ncbi:alpha/beta fold hydrolase [Sphingosinicella humi]|uniref:Proline iminopeptidase n=1 Tax=Allosphingosinicella humi TaxID=2068657 RepID=A0A2U2J1B9_9SPHN|nr:alpha/beta fold hydrolase [Sphingosinicella humi]PWG02124.1 alpha/beta hydrolase [Sphingosinicella humi]
MLRLPLFLSAVALCAAPVLAAAPDTADPYAASRDIVADIGRIVTPDGVQETFTVELGGARQVVNVRGADRANPVLLFIHGGPGAVEMPIAWSFQRPWEDFFTVVQWDQRGAGRSYPLNDPEAIAPTMTLERYRDDAIQLIEMLRAKYGKRKIFVLGHSWGSAVGLAVAAKRPDLLHAYVGMGQIIDFRENERVGMAWTVEEAHKRGDEAAVREVEALRPYPDSGAFTIDQADGWRKWAIRYGALAAYRPDANFYLRAPRLSPEYSAEDRQAWADGAVFTVKTLFPRLADLSFKDVRRLEVPVIMLLGRHDYATPSSITYEWMGDLSAPKKQVIWFEHSAHLPMIEEPGRTLKALINEVRPLGAVSD